MEILSARGGGGRGSRVFRGLDGKVTGTAHEKTMVPVVQGLQRDKNRWLWKF